MKKICKQYKNLNLFIIFALFVVKFPSRNENKIVA